MRTPCFFTLHSPSQLGRMLQRHHQVFVHSTPGHDTQTDLKQLQDKKPNFGISLNSAYAYHPQTSSLLTQAINERLGLSRARRMQIITCLQEALTNAVVHGNLCVERHFNSLAEFNAYHQQVHEALDEPMYSNLRVYVRAWDYGRSLLLNVRHAGSGRLEDLKLFESHPSLEQKTGRGLYIIQSLAEQVWSDDAGKSLSITFTY